ncbi:MAG: hypothetical protein P8130_09270 [Deltaproteobacteria bacterium]|jgi:hypothetical protein
MLDHLIPKLRFQLAIAEKILPEDGVAVIEKVYNDILLMRNFVVNEFQAINEDKKLSERDKDNSRRQVLEKAITKLEILKSKRSASDLINELEAKLSAAPPDTEDRLLKFLREKEVRDRLAKMSVSQILSHFENSLLDGSNSLLLDAILNTPPGFEILPEKILQKLRRVRGKKYYPEIVAQLEALQSLDSILVKMFTLVRAELDALRRKYLPIYVVKKTA